MVEDMNDIEVLPNLKRADKESQVVIEISQLGKAFGDQQVLVNISMKLFEGENLVVIGRSGSGKSVLIKCIIRLLEADRGSINLFGENVMDMKSDSLSEMRKKIGFLFQSGALYDSMTVRQNLEFPLRRMKHNLKEPEIDA